MSAAADVNAGRRHFIIGAGVVGGGLLVGKYLAPRFIGAGGTELVRFQPHAFLRITSDDVVTVIVGKSEMGQGIHTGLCMILAEELDIDPQRVQLEVSGVDPAFNHPFLPAQFTGGSNSTQTTFDPLRKAGATARAMLLAAAGQRWGIDAAELRTEDGVVLHGSRRASYGSLAAAAAALPVPAEVKLKDRAEFRYLGKPLARRDNLDKVTGRAKFGSDVQLPDMLIAMVARAPAMGATLRSFDDGAARAIAGVVAVKRIPTGVAVLATSTWAASRGRDALSIDWDLSASAALSSEQLREDFGRRALTRGLIAHDVGDVDAAIAAAQRRMDVLYEFPYLAHACMEPLNAVVHVTPGKCEIWTGTQAQSLDAQAAAHALGIAPAQVVLHTMYLGGGFGRRANTDSDFVVEATHVANGVGRPVKTIWTREDDMRGGYYRPLSVNRVRAALDATGMPMAYHHVTVGKPVLANSPFRKFAMTSELDPTSIEGSADMPYAVPNLRVEVHNTNEPVPILWWRSVGHTITGFVTNCAIDELAILGGRDAVELRRALLANRPRHLAVLDRVVEAARYGEPLPTGRFHGVALHESFGSIVAQVAEVSVDGDTVRVHKVCCAVDCGFAVNPAQVVAQMESGIVFALSAALYGEISIDQGQVRQGNFDSYPIVRIDESPQIEVHIVPSDAALGGIGEPGVPPLAPAVCNAIFRATGKRIRRLPISAALRS